MTHEDEIVALADATELTYSGGKSGYLDGADLTRYLVAFAEAVAGKERERCAKAAEDFLTKGRSPLGRSVADAIRRA